MTPRLLAFLLVGCLAGWFAAVVLLPCLCDLWRVGLPNVSAGGDDDSRRDGDE